MTTDRRASTVPRATYRLQLGPALGFDAAAELVPYLADLGISHLYLSPVLQAGPGSTHGYDVADPGTVSEDLGGEAGLRRLADAAHTAGLGIVVDIVPNHVVTSVRNPLWRGLLAEGRAGGEGGTFDVDWATPLPGGADKVILPVLGRPYGEVLAAGELRVVDAGDACELAYHDQRFPLSAESTDALRRAGGPDVLGGKEGELSTWARLHSLLELQHYRLVHWRAGGLVNYRRFFAINDLAAVRIESDTVFDRIHDKVLQLVDDGVVDGLRVDHVDGLVDPARYLERLADRVGDRWIVVEKITAAGELLPDWPVAGTTGYDFLNDVVALFVDPGARETLDAAARAHDALPDERDGERAAKRAAAQTELAPDLWRLGRVLWAATSEHLEHRDVDERSCRDALVAVIAHLPVYRTYVDPRSGDASEQDRALVRAAVAAAATDAGDVPRDLYRFLERALVGDAGDTPSHLELISRFQQLSGAVMAKGVEDTWLYRHRRLLAVNDVGGMPDRLGDDGVDAFHAANAARALRHPIGMLTTATHDTKRGEDVRVRIAALSEIADRWHHAVRGWKDAHASLATATARGPAPDAATAYLVYQTLVGVWPPDGAVPGPDVATRVADYAVKASREAKERSTWTDPDAAFEEGVARFVARLLDPSTCGSFLSEMGTLARAAGRIALASGLAQVLLRCTAPGVPDTYQGTELWEDSLVDPDNRRPVDFAARAAALERLDALEEPSSLWGRAADGHVKLWVLSRALRARTRLADAFSGRYEPLAVTGRWSGHVVAFARRGTGRDEREIALVVTPRLPGAVMGADLADPLGPRWDDTAIVLPDDLAAVAWVDVLGGPGGKATGTGLGIGEILTVLPVALLVAEDS